MPPISCPECHVEMVPETNVEYPYSECGLPHITLLGVDKRTCPQCKTWDVGIPAMSHLHTKIAYALARKPSYLLGLEIRFLRSYLEVTGRQFAVWCGVSPETVSRWEHGATVISPLADRLLRLTVAPGLEISRAVAIGHESAPLKLRLAYTGGRGWEVLE